MDNRGIRRSTGSGLLEGAAILGAAAAISKLLGTLQKIPLQNLAGDGVFGIYNAVYPLYILLLTLATAGIPAAVSKFVSEELALGRTWHASRLLRIACVVLFASGFLFFILLYFGAGRIASWIGIAQTEPAIRSIAAALLFVPVMAALRGYFQGHKNMVPSALSQVIEQLVRVFTMVLLLLLLLHWGAGDEWIAAGATFGSVTGALAGLLFLLVYWVKHAAAGKKAENRMEEIPFAGRTMKKAADKHKAVAPEPMLSVVYRFLRYAVPISLGSLVVPLLTLVDTFTLPRLLMNEGNNESAALYQFGLYHHGMPLIQLITLVAGSMSTALVPAIAQARVREDWMSIRQHSVQSIQFTWWLGLAASLGLALTSFPLNIMFYRNGEGWEVIAILAFVALFSTVHIVSSAILQGIGDLRKPMYHLLIAAVVKIGLNLVLVPVWGIHGGALAAVAAYAAACGLNLLALHKHGIGMAWSLKAHSQALLASAAMCGAVAVILLLSQGLLSIAGSFFPYRGYYTIVALLAVITGILVYAVVLFRGRDLQAEQLEHVPGAGRKIGRLLKKLRFIK
ncbi:putative polysaccharide biosynthesis protein [Paenibacillus senegalensis]|uniref:putative polysaccharide biosynthesis protein n=1 Tax=Paenibacillus senegalensis TaxID=1465766 RepID=UPI0002D52AD2|nr:polysaccharide biosynthesis protein [Paenibacillus senegalensis]